MQVHMTSPNMPSFGYSEPQMRLSWSLLNPITSTLFFHHFFLGPTSHVTKIKSKVIILLDFPLSSKGWKDFAFMWRPERSLPFPYLPCILLFVGAWHRTAIPNGTTYVCFLWSSTRSNHSSTHRLLTFYGALLPVIWPSKLSNSFLFNYQMEDRRLQSKSTIQEAPGELSWLSIWLWLRSWSYGSWVWAPHQVLC